MYVYVRLSSKPRGIYQDIRFPCQNQTQEIPNMKQHRHVRLRDLVAECLLLLTILIQINFFLGAFL
jgi:hypothetical protein